MAKCITGGQTGLVTLLFMECPDCPEISLSHDIADWQSGSVLASVHKKLVMVHGHLVLVVLMTSPEMLLTWRRMLHGMPQCIPTHLESLAVQ